MKKQKTTVIMPAYNAERTLLAVHRHIPKDLVDEVILVDDCSKDKTVALSKKTGIKTVVHVRNMGYGANQKTCYRTALENRADFVIMLHPDGQYDPKDIPLFINALKSGKGDLILGSRFLDNGDKETPFYKAISIKFITILFNSILKINITEANTGYRGFTRKLLESIPLEKNGNGYIFDPQLIIQTAYFGFKIAEVPVTKKYNMEAISPNFRKSVEHGLENMLLLLQYSLQKRRIRDFDFLTLEQPS